MSLQFGLATSAGFVDSSLNIKKIVTLYSATLVNNLHVSLETEVKSEY